MSDHPGHPLRPNFRARPFWNPTKILPHEHEVHVHRMDLNECPHPPSPKVVAAIAEAASGLNRYPDGTCPLLTPVLAERLSVPAEQICWGAGSTQLLTAIAQIAVNTGDELVSPGLIWRRFAGVFNVVDAEHQAVDNLPDGRIDVDGILAAVGNNTRLVIVLTPNNPTGLMMRQDELERLATEVPGNCLLFVDEAYFEFARHAGGPDALEVLKQRTGPWAVTRTFSKAYALAGLRLGYAICSDEEIANALRLVTSTFNLVGIAEAAALAALEDPEHAEMILETNARELARITEGVSAMGLATMASVTNFIPIDVRRPAGPVIQGLRDRRVRVAGFGYEASGHFIRVSTGTPEDTDAFLTALEQVLDSMPESTSLGLTGEPASP